MNNTDSENSTNSNPLEKTPISGRKREANRKNAQKSTGPRTVRGKGYSRMNATKHGFYAEKARLTLCGEEELEFSELCAEIRFELDTSGVLEELEAERIAMFHWKLLRLFRFENAVIGLGTQRVAQRWSQERGPLDLKEIFGDESPSTSQADQCSQNRPAELANSSQVSDPNASDPSVPPPSSMLATLLRYREEFQEEHYDNMSQAEMDREAVPDQIYLDTIHRAQRASEKGLNDALRRFKNLRKWRQRVKLSDGNIFDDEGDVVI